MRKTYNLAPEPSRFTSAKLRYDHLSDIIERKAVPFKYIQDSNICLHMDEVDDLYEICQKERRIVLLGDSYAEKNMWISHGQNSVEKLVNFEQSATTLKFLLKEIKNPRHY